jgi:1-acyl-sn-glycerol-3-phosphate acyltransferase
VLLQAATRAVVAPMARLVFRPTVEGRHHVPQRGPVILAANHLSFVDSIVIPIVAPRPVAFLAKAEYFGQPGMKGWLTGTSLRAIDAIPVQRGAHRAAQASLELALGVLADGRIYRGRTGVAWLALTSGAPVVPVAVRGTDRIQPVGARIPRPGRITVRFGPPLVFDTTVNNGQTRRAVTDDIMAAIAGLSGQPLADAYNEHSAA